MQRAILDKHINQNGEVSCKKKKKDGFYLSHFLVCFKSIQHLLIFGYGAVGFQRPFYSTD